MNVFRNVETYSSKLSFFLLLGISVMYVYGTNDLIPGDIESKLTAVGTFTGRSAI